MERGEWSERVVVVSGAARGQGLSHACAFAEQGAHLVLLDVPEPMESVPYQLASPGDLREAHEQVDAAGPGRVLSFEVDVRDVDRVTAAIDAAAAEFGGIDVVVANAGVFSFAANSWELEPQTWRECVDVILFGSWTVARAAIPHQLERPGASIVFIGSVSAHKGIAATGHYVAAKHGVVGLMRTLAVELAPHGVRVNMVSPTATRTLMATNPAMAQCVEYQEAGGTNMSNLLPVDLLEPADVSDAVVWLASSHARYVTGEVVKVDAGFTAR